MPNFKKKSEENYSAGGVLILNEMYSSSIHCFYYSSFQLSKYILRFSFSIDYSEQDRITINKDSHKTIIKKVRQELRQIDETKALTYQRLMNDLKLKRKKADYNVEFIAESEAIEAKEYCNEIVNILNTDGNN